MPLVSKPTFRIKEVQNKQKFEFKGTFILSYRNIEIYFHTENTDKLALLLDQFHPIENQGALQSQELHRFFKQDLLAALKDFTLKPLKAETVGAQRNPYNVFQTLMSIKNIKSYPPSDLSLLGESSTSSVPSLLHKCQFL